MDDWGDPWADSSERNADYQLKGGSGTVLAGFGDDAGWNEWAGGDIGAWGPSNGENEKHETEAEKEMDNGSLEHATATAASETVLHDVPEDRIYPETIAMDIRASTVLKFPQEDRSAPVSISLSEPSEDGKFLSPESVRMSIGDMGSLGDPAVARTNPDVAQEVVNMELKDATVTPVERHLEQTTDSRTRPGPCESMLEEQRLRQTPSSIHLPLIDQLFGSLRVAEDLLEPKSSLISTSSVRKAWYRLSRPETLRGYNSGETDGNYVRVTWPKSGIRNETINVISKLVTEDLNRTKEEPMSGNTVLFNWNAASEPAAAVQEPPSLKDAPRFAVKATSHGRNKSLPVTSLPAPEPLVVFSWSALPTEGSAWSDISLPDGPSARPTSMQLSGVKEEQSQHKRAVTFSGTTIQATGTSQPGLSFDFLKKPTGNFPVLPAELSMPKTTDETEAENTPQENDLLEEEDDDDDWGEMVQSPVSPETTSDATTIGELTETDIRVLSRKRPTPVSKPRSISPHEVQLPESFLSELPRKAAIRSYLTDKVARISSNSKPPLSNIAEPVIIENDETLDDAKSERSLQIGIPTDKIELEKNLNTDPAADETIPEDTQQLSTPFHPNEEKMDLELPTAKPKSKDLPEPNNAIPSMDNVAKPTHFESTLQHPEISITTEHSLAENDEKLEDMLGSLPDLSYMLR
jgi:hypothetical protein